MHISTLANGLRVSSGYTKLRPAASYHAIVGQVLARERQTRGYSQAQVAAAVGVTQSTWSRIERGQQILGLGQLRVASTFLGARPDEVLRAAEGACSHCIAQGVQVVDVPTSELDPTPPKKASAPNASDAATAGLIAIGIGALAILVIAALED